MTQKIRVAFIYKKSCGFLTGRHFASSYYNFFMKALKRNHRINVTYFATEDSFDASLLKDKFDVILLYENHNFCMPNEILGIKDLDIPVIARVGDPQGAKTLGTIKYHTKYKINYYFDLVPESAFYKYYPSNFKYKVIIYGLEPDVYENLPPYNTRIKNRIINSGNIGNPKIISRIINTIRNPHSNSYKHYKLRTMCNKLSYVDYTPTLSHQYVGDKYPLLLSKYASAIAATTYYPTIKYWEIPASGCLTFMEITEKNKGDYLGFIDGETAIFINEKNYQDKFEEFLRDHDNPKWERIANAGRKYALTNFNNDKAVNTLVDLMEELI